MTMTSIAATVSPYIEISKLRLGSLVVVTSAVGFLAANHGPLPILTFLNTIVGVTASCAGAAALNNYMERNFDGAMERTMCRPLPSGRLSPLNALLYGIVLTVLSTAFLAWQVNVLCGFLALMTSFLYVLVYTPLKRVHWLNTFVGAIPGALPILGGWAAATNSLSPGAWVLFLIMFVWQHPHFYAIAWVYRDDYERGGYKMLSVVDKTGARLFRQMIGYAVLLIPLSLLPTALGMSGMIYFYAAAVLGVMFLVHSLYAAKSRAIVDSKRLFHFSIIYLPVLLALAIFDKI